MSKNLLFEIGTEELPARFIEPALESILSFTQKKLKDLELTFEDIKVGGTCRRLSLFIEALAEKQSDKEEEILGPSLKIGQDEKGNYTPALLGFVKKHSAELNQLFIKDTPKGPYFCLKKLISGQKTIELLPNFLIELLHNIYFPKRMHWGNFDFTFARPIKWLLALYGEELIPLEIATIKSQRLTYGHRFLSPGPINIASANWEYYKEELLKNYVILEVEERKNHTLKSIHEVSVNIGIPVIEEDLLRENANLLEYPFPVLGRFSEKFLKLPEKLVITALQEHQRYFFLRNTRGELLPYFIAVNNNKPKNPEIVIQGHERVARARLEDALFYYERDIKRPLKSYVEKLKGIVYHIKCGTLFEKTERLIGIGKYLGKHLFPYISPQDIEKACLYAKADLATEVVKEFPGLQGYMGNQYLSLEGEKNIAPAIYEQYLPSPKDEAYPETTLGIILSLADKIDHLCALIGAGEKVSGEGDPYALRRAAYGIIKILLIKEIDLKLEPLLDFSLSLLKNQGYLKNKRALQDLLEFLRKRLEGEFLSIDFTKNFIQVVINQPLNPHIQHLKLKALKEIFPREDFQDLATLFKRITQILKNIDLSTLPAIDPQLFEYEAEKKLFEKSSTLEPILLQLELEKNYLKYLEELLQFKPLIDTFFDEVFVMVDEEKLRFNRLSLLKRVSEYFYSFGDLSSLA
jgi:glycyl-tRNA synthetase beta chain